MGIPHPDGVAVVATDYGDAKQPGWYHRTPRHAQGEPRTAIEQEAWDTSLVTTPASAGRSGRKASTSSLVSPEERAWAGDRQIEAFVLKRS